MRFRPAFCTRRATVEISAQKGKLDVFWSWGMTILSYLRHNQPMPTELELKPVGGMPRWLGSWATDRILRALSMVEQPGSLRSMAISPVDGYFRRDRHVHPRVDGESYRLRMRGLAGARDFSLDGLGELPQAELVCVQECAGNGNHLMGSAGLVGQAVWSGPRLETLIDACGGAGAAKHLVFQGLDGLGIRRGYHYGLSLEELVRADAIVALRMNGEPLTRRHGFPARLVVPRIYAMAHVKWLGEIEGKTAPHRGVHNTRVYVNKEKRGRRWTKVQARWIGLKSVVTRCVRLGADGETGDGWILEGLAWGGSAPIESVDVSVDGGASWSRATVVTPEEVTDSGGAPAQAFRGGWVPFRLPWKPSPGAYRVGSRARAADGTVQPSEMPKHVRGHFDQCQIKWRDVEVPG